jgi:LAS superfamily LD-carboxypeptidase LdcB
MKKKKPIKKAQAGAIMGPQPQDFNNQQDYYLALGEWANSQAGDDVTGLKPIPQEQRLQTSTSRFQDVKNQMPSVQASMQASSRDLSKPSAQLRQKKPATWGKTALTALSAFDALIPNGDINPPIVRPKTGYNAFQYGTGSQAIAQDGKKIKDSSSYYRGRMISNMNMADKTSGDVKEHFTNEWKQNAKDLNRQEEKKKPSIEKAVTNVISSSLKRVYADGGDIQLSTTGYKANSKDNNKPKLRIPSNQITMKNVPHPVIGTGSDGSQQLMMPEQEYFFPNAEYVDEQPLAQKGAIITNNPNDPRLIAYNDSLMTYNNQIAYDSELRKLAPNFKNNGNATNILNKLNSKYPVNEKLVGTGPDDIVIYKYLNGKGEAKLNYNAKVTEPVQPVVYQKPQQAAQKPVQAPIKKGQPTYEDSLNAYNFGLTQAQKEVNAYKKKGIYTDNGVPIKATPRLESKEIINQALDAFGSDAYKDKRIKPVGFYEIPTADVPFFMYKKPVGTPKVIEPQEPKFKRPISPATNIPVLNSMGQPQIGVPNLQQAKFDSSKPTNYSFTNATGNYLEGQQTYFPDEQSLRKFAQGQNNVSIQSNSTGATATGYIKEMKKGGKMKKPKGQYIAKNYEDGGQLEIEGNQFEPISSETMVLRGPSHDNGGIEVAYNGRRVEAEGGEPIFISKDGSANIMGNMKNPVTGNKFKHDAMKLAKKEAKVNKLMDYSTALVNNANPYDKWESLKFNAGAAMMQGAKMKSDQLKSSKEHLSELQQAMLELKDEGLETAKNGMKLPKAQRGVQLSDGRSVTYAQWVKMQNQKTMPTQNTPPPTSPTGVNPIFQDAFKKMLAEAPDYVKAQGYNMFSSYRDRAKQQALWDKSDKTGKWVAAPGKSEHEYGIAADLQDNKGRRIGKGDKTAMEWVHQNAPKYGLQFRMGHEPWHISLKSDMGDGQWTGDYHPENYDSNPNNNIALKGRAQYKGVNTPNASKKEEQSADEFSIGRVKAPPFKDILAQNQGPQNTTIKPGNYNWNMPPLPAPIPSGTDAENLQFEQIPPEIYAGATNQEDPVWLQQFQPDLFQPYQVSLQDRRNRITSTGRASRQYLGDNANAQATLATGEYDAINNVDAEEFRINQGIANDVISKNTALLNESQLTNLKLADTQYTRQSTARSKTKAANQDILNSLSNKVLQNRLENRTLQVYENLYPHFRFGDDFVVDKVGNPGQDYLNTSGLPNQTTPYTASSTNTYDGTGSLKQIKTMNPSQLDVLNKEASLQAKKQRNMQKMFKDSRFNPF